MDRVVVTFKVDAGLLVSFPILSESVVFSEDLFEVKGVEFADIFDAKIISNQAKHNRMPLVAPEAKSGGALLLVMGLEAFLEQIVGEGAQLGKAIDSVADIKINPAVNMYVFV